MKYLKPPLSIFLAVALWLTAIFHILLISVLIGRKLGFYLLGDHWMFIALPIHVCALGLLLLVIMGALFRVRIAGFACAVLFLVSMVSTVVLTVRSVDHGMTLRDTGIHMFTFGHVLSWLALGVLMVMFRKKMFEGRPPKIKTSQLQT